MQYQGGHYVQEQDFLAWVQQSAGNPVHENHALSNTCRVAAVPFLLKAMRGLVMWEDELYYSHWRE